MLKTIKNIILVDETQPLEIIKKQYKSKTYWFIGLSWLVSFLLIWIIPQNIMQYGWAKSFVDFMGVIVPMVDGLENIRLYGSSDPYKAHLIVLPHISFYYALLWAYAWVSVPLILHYEKSNNKYSDGVLIKNKKMISTYKNKKILYYLSIFILIIFMVHIYTDAEPSYKWFKLQYIYSLTAGFFSHTFTIGFFHIIIVILFIQTHFLTKQQEKQDVK